MWCNSTYINRSDNEQYNRNRKRRMQTKYKFFVEKTKSSDASRSNY